MALTPFTEKRWYSGGSNGSDALKQYSKNSGVRFDISYWLNPRWQISSALEYGEQRYDWRKHLNGNNYLFSNTLLYVPKSGQHWFAGVDYSRENTRDKDNAYQRTGGRFGWGLRMAMGNIKPSHAFICETSLSSGLISLTFVRKIENMLQH